MLQKPQETQDDRQLLMRVQAGDRHAAQLLVEQIGPIVNRVVYRLTGWHNDTQDLVQDVFLEIQRSGHRFRNESQLNTWATAITVHCCRKWIRARKRSRAAIVSMNVELVDDHPARVARQAENHEEIAQALRKLDHRQRELIVLRYLEEWTLEEMCEFLQVKKNQLEVRLHRARKRLGKLLESRIDGWKK